MFIIYQSKLCNQIVRSHEWQLIETAAYSSSQVYHPQSENGILVPAKGDIKPSTVCYKKINGGGLLVVAIRGSITLDDWLKNFNGAPQPWTEVRVVVLTLAKLCQRDADFTSSWRVISNGILGL